MIFVRDKSGFKAKKRKGTKNAKSISKFSF